MWQNTSKLGRVHNQQLIKAPLRCISNRSLEALRGGKASACIVIQAVAHAFDVTPSALKSRQRDAQVALARQVAMYLVHCSCKLSLTEAGVAFGRDRTTVAHACKRVEDMREDPLFDWRLDRIDWAVRTYLDFILSMEAA